MEENNIINHLESCEKDIHMIKLDMQIIKDNIVLIKELLNNYLLYYEKKNITEKKGWFF